MLEDEKANYASEYARLAEVYVRNVVRCSFVFIFAPLFIVYTVRAYCFGGV